MRLESNILLCVLRIDIFNKAGTGGFNDAIFLVAKWEDSTDSSIVLVFINLRTNN